MENSDRKITTPFVWNQFFQGRVSDEDDSMTISMAVIQRSDLINARSHYIELKRHKGIGWSEWAAINQKVVWDD